MEILFVIAILVVMLVIWYITTVNKLNRTIVKIDEADSGIDVALTKRYDVLVKMMDTVKAYAKHEKETLFEVINLRKGMTLDEKNAVNDKMNSNFDKIRVIAESYPELKSSENYKVLQDSIVEEYKIKHENTPIILNGMPLDKYYRKMDYTIKDNVKIIHVGRFMEQKNHVGLIKAFRVVCDRYPNAILNLFGTGELEEEIKVLVKSLGLVNNVVFNGVSHNIANELTKNDIFCLPSNYEGVPLTLIEAMASAMPIVATNVGGVADMLRNNIDAIITENDIDHISSGIIELVKSEDLRKKMGESALFRSEAFSSKFMCEEYYKLYNKRKDE